MYVATGELIDRSIQTLRQVGKKGTLGVDRWDQFLKAYKASGVVKIPVELGANVPFPTPFYFVLEKMGPKKLMFIKPCDGSEPYRLGDVYGFFGFSQWPAYTRGQPIFVVEGMIDWLAIRTFYPFVLCTFTAGIGNYQWFVLKQLTDKVFAGFDKDRAGATALKNVTAKAKKLGVNVKNAAPGMKDWGAMLESEWGHNLLERQGEALLRQVREWK